MTNAVKTNNKIHAMQLNVLSALKHPLFLFPAKIPMCSVLQTVPQVDECLRRLTIHHDGRSMHHVGYEIER